MSAAPGTAPVASAIFAALPGIETPVADVHRMLAELWDTEPGGTGGKGAVSEFRASQMNLVVHFGLEATSDEARAGFETALGFSRRYPCRIIALCPQPEGGGGDIAAKIFSECYVGAARHDMTCTEAIILTYPLEQRAYLEDQASILLESDLPLFYWPQHISQAGRLADYGFFLKHAQRIVIDTAVEKPEVAAFPWPRPAAVHDLAWGRVLPVRQSMGHFLSYIEPARLVQGLRRIELRHHPEFAAEGRQLELWMRRGVRDCAAVAASGTGAADVPAFVLQADAQMAGSITIVWSYAERGGLTFHFDFTSGVALLESTLDCGSNRVGATVRLLPADKALSEVLFF